MTEQVQEIRIDQLRGFKDHPFRVKDNEELQALCDSIREYGVLSPLLARPTEDGYEIISGHRRKAAALKLGLDKLPVLVRDMTDDEAVILMVDSNIQRENLLPSEMYLMCLIPAVEKTPAVLTFGSTGRSMRTQ